MRPTREEIIAAFEQRREAELTEAFAKEGRLCYIEQRLQDLDARLRVLEGEPPVEGS